MIELFDTHAHFEGTDAETVSVLNRAVSSGVTRVMAVGGSLSLNKGVETAAKCGADGFKVWKCIGWDRDQVGKDLPMLDYTGVAAVGEIGLDYHYSPDTRKAQLDLMARQWELARDMDRPVVIHTRDADDDTLGLVHRHYRVALDVLEVVDLLVGGRLAGKKRHCRSDDRCKSYISLHILFVPKYSG